MRNIGLFRETGRLDLAGAYPGMSPTDAALVSTDVKFELEAARLAGHGFASVVLHVETHRARLRPRSELAAELHFAGVRRLARRVERSRPPLGSFEAFIDCEGRTELITARLADLLGDD